MSQLKVAFVNSDSPQDDQVKLCFEEDIPLTSNASSLENHKDVETSEEVFPIICGDEICNGSCDKHVEHSSELFIDFMPFKHSFGLLVT